MAGMIDCQIPGIDAFMQSLHRYPASGPRAMAAALLQEAEAIMAKSKPLVPVDVGNLKSSGHVQLPSIVGLSASVTFGYGGPAVKYAWHVHENLLARHTVGQAKYLEQPLLEAKAGMLARIALKVREQIRSTTMGAYLGG